jgi:signal transduction histidine kinase
MSDDTFDDLDHIIAISAVLLQGTDEAQRLFVQQRDAAAMFRGPEQDLVLETLGWRAIFSGALPDTVRALMKQVEASGDPQRVPALVIADDPPRVVKVVAHPAAHGTLAACVEVSDELMAHVLGVTESALIWSGRTFEPDFTSATLRRYVGTATEWLHPDDVVQYRNVIAAGATHGTVEARIRRADGDFRWHRVKIESRGTRWYAAASDVSNISFAQLFKDRFFSAMLHDLKTPVATVSLWEKILRDHCDDTELRQRALDAIRCSISMQTRVMTDLMDMSRALAGTLALARTPLSLESIVGAALREVQPAADAKAITIVRDTRQRLGRLYGDDGRVRQILVTILRNAIKYTDRDGVVTVSSRRLRGSIELSIRDTGRGIAPEMVDRVFEPLRRDREVPTPDSGLGISLALALRLAELHGGSLTASSPGLGMGATFTLKLPSISRQSTADSLVG